jgi:hypothetical protein
MEEWTDRPEDATSRLIYAAASMAWPSGSVNTSAAILCRDTFSFSGTSGATASSCSIVGRMPGCRLRWGAEMLSLHKIWDEQSEAFRQVRGNQPGQGGA